MVQLLNSNLFRLVGAKGQRRGEGRRSREQHLLQTLCQQVQQASCSLSYKPRERTYEVAMVRTFLLPLNSRQGKREADDLQRRCGGGGGFGGGRRGGAFLGVREHRPQHLRQSEGQDTKISGEIGQESLATNIASLRDLAAGTISRNLQLIHFLTCLFYFYLENYV